MPLHSRDAAEPQPLTRRELRARERATEATQELLQSEGAETNPVPPCVPSPHRMPPLRASSSPHSAPREHHRPSAAAKGFSLLAMVFAVGMAVATTVPANALMSSADVVAARAADDGVPEADGVSFVSGVQRILSEDEGPETITRDKYDSVATEVVYGLANARHADTFTNDAGGTVQWPFRFGVPISDFFGPRIAPTAGASSFHEGVDFAPGNGTPIQVIADGTVREVHPYDDSGYGVHVIIDHVIDGQPVASVYGHMQTGSIEVTAGQKVKVGDTVGLVGNTGISTGAHLHFEVWLGGTTPTDPYAWMKEHAN